MGRFAIVCDSRLDGGIEPGCGRAAACRSQPAPQRDATAYRRRAGIEMKGFMHVPVHSSDSLAGCYGVSFTLRHDGSFWGQRLCKSS